jgi:hypothetical protein
VLLLGTDGHMLLTALPPDGDNLSQGEPTPVWVMAQPVQRTRVRYRTVGPSLSLPTTLATVGAIWAFPGRQERLSGVEYRVALRRRPVDHHAKSRFRARHAASPPYGDTRGTTPSQVRFA